MTRQVNPSVKTLFSRIKHFPFEVEVWMQCGRQLKVCYVFRELRHKLGKKFCALVV